MSNTLSIGIVGCGGIANGKHLPALSQISDARMTAFCDVVSDRADSARVKFGVPDARTFADADALFADPSIDVVHICTPNDSHANLTIAALEAGKHVMCEKPMAKTAADARRMVDAAKKSGKKLTIGYQNRFRADSQYLKKICAAGELGDIYFARGHALRRRAVPTWGVFLDEEKQGGGPLIDIGTHALDLTLWMMDNYEPKTVMGAAFHKLSQRENAANAWGTWDTKKFTVEDSAFGFITLKNGALITLDSSWALNVLDTSEASCTLAGTEGGADMKGGLRLNGERFSTLYENTIQFDGGGVAFYDSDGVDPAVEEQRAWIAAVQNDTEVVVKPEQACVVSEILEAIYESAKTGKAVYFD